MEMDGSKAADNNEITSDIILAEAHKLQKHFNSSKEVLASELLKQNTMNIPSLLDPILPKVGLASLAGSSDVGKSTFLRQLAISIALGEEQFLKWQLDTKWKSAIYVSTEDDEISISFLLNKYNRIINRHPNDYKKLRYIFETNEILNTLEESLSNTPADIVIIDAFTDLYGGNLSESNKVRTYLNEFSQLAQRHKCLVMFLHHTGKRTEDEEPSKNNLLGSQGFESKMRLVIELRADPSDIQTRHLCIVKGNYLPPEYKQESYVLKFDENQIFKFTNDRRAFEFLRKNHNKEKKSKQRYETANKLKIQGLTHNEIAAQIGYKSKSSVSQLFKRYDEEE